MEISINESKNNRKPILKDLKPGDCFIEVEYANGRRVGREDWIKRHLYMKGFEKGEAFSWCGPTCRVINLSNGKSEWLGETSVVELVEASLSIIRNDSIKVLWNYTDIAIGD